MLGNFDLKALLIFPVKDDDARKKFLYLSLAYFAGFIIPILPLILAMGYSARVMRNVINGEGLQMPPWDEYENMLKDGVYLFGVRLIFMLPIFIIVFPMYFVLILMPLLAAGNQDSLEPVIGSGFLIFGIVMLILIPISIFVGIVLPAAESHVVANNDFASGFRVREWWAIFRANWSGFLIAYLLSFIVSIPLSLVIGVLAMTLVLLCLAPFIMPVVSAYLTLVLYAAFAQAYKEGRERLAAPSKETPQNASA